MRLPKTLALLVVASGLLAPAAHAQHWVPVGPPGGDVRSLAVDPRNPQRIYLGTAEGVLYRSEISGLEWQRLSPGFPLRGQSLDEIVVSPTGALLIGYWDVRGSGGGVAVSVDRGNSFKIATGLEGESVRALALAPSDPRRAVAGTLSGVFASKDGGLSWRRITPEGHEDLRQVESVAFDPRDPRIIYVGTWHLPWKTVDAGLNWSPSHDGMLDDSDVFTMTVDAATRCAFSPPPAPASIGPRTRRRTGRGCAASPSAAGAHALSRRTSSAPTSSMPAPPRGCGSRRTTPRAGAW